MGKELVKRSTGETLGRVTISIGVAEINADDSVQSIIDRADKCLYAAKNAGRNRVMSELDVNDQQEEEPLPQGLCLPAAFSSIR
jgi:diguanylate cyclase